MQHGKLTTERTIIERISLEDADFILALVNSPGWIRFIGDRDISNLDDARRYLQDGFLKSCRDNGFGYYSVRLACTLEPVGICGFLKRPYLDNADFGFALLPDYFGRGLAYEACRAVLAYGARAFAFPVLDAVTVPDNLRSMRLLEKLGFERQDQGINMPGDECLLLYRRRSPEKTAVLNG